MPAKGCKVEPVEQKLRLYRSILRDAALKAETLESALVTATFYGQLNFQNQDGLLSDDELELALFKRHLAHLVVATDRPTDGTETKLLHVATKTYSFGGHTRLIERLLQMRAEAGDADAVFVGPPVNALFASRCRALNVELIEAGGTLTERCLSLITTGMRFSGIFLHIHPEDIGAALAARYLRHRGKRVYFINHADERFSFGSGAAEVVCELSGYGWRLTANGRAHNAQHFLGIPISSLGAWAPDPSSAKKLVLSIGQSHKYKPSAELDFPQFAARIITRTDCTFQIIGTDGKEPWWTSARRMYPDNFIFIKESPHDELRGFLNKAACYVDSFPVTGGTAFSEAVYFGLPSFGLGNIAIGYSIADGIRSDNLASMEQSLIAYLLDNKVSYDIRHFIDLMDGYASSTAINRRLTAALQGRYEKPPLELIAVASKVQANFYEKKWLEGQRINLPLPTRNRLASRVRLRYAFAILTNSDIAASDYIRLLKFCVRRPKQSSPE
jgi:hypothetical protein